MLINKVYFAVLLKIALSLLAMSNDAFSQPSLTSFIETLENEHSQSIDRFLESVADQNLSANPRFEHYGGELGNKYFQYYSQTIIIPALIKYIKILNKIPKEQLISKKDSFVKLVHALGQVRRKIAIKTQSKDALSFGEPTNKLIETIAHGTKNDPSWLVWLEYLQNYFGLNTIDFSKHPTLEDVLNTIAQFIRMSGNKNLVTRNEDIFLSVKNGTPDNFYVGTYRIELLSGSSTNDPYAGVTKDIKLINKSDIQFTFFHTVALYENLSKLFFATLDSNISQPNLLYGIGRFFFFWCQASIFRHGQSAVGEWIIQAIAQSAGYKLIFSEAWQGKSNGTMAPNMYALSILDDKAFMKEFLENARLASIPQD